MIRTGFRRRENSFSSFLEKNALLFSSLASFAKRSAFLSLENCSSLEKRHFSTSLGQIWQSPGVRMGKGMQRSAKYRNKKCYFVIMARQYKRRAWPCTVSKCSITSGRSVESISLAFSGALSISLGHNFLMDNFHISPRSEMMELIESCPKIHFLPHISLCKAQNLENTVFSPFSHFSMTPNPFLLNPGYGL